MSFKIGDTVVTNSNCMSPSLVGRVGVITHILMNGEVVSVSFYTKGEPQGLTLGISKLDLVEASVEEASVMYDTSLLDWLTPRT